MHGGPGDLGRDSQGTVPADVSGLPPPHPPRHRGGSPRSRRAGVPRCAQPASATSTSGWPRIRSCSRGVRVGRQCPPFFPGRGCRAAAGRRVRASRACPGRRHQWSSTSPSRRPASSATRAPPGLTVVGFVPPRDRRAGVDPRSARLAHPRARPAVLHRTPELCSAPGVAGLGRRGPVRGPRWCRRRPRPPRWPWGGRPHSAGRRGLAGANRRGGLHDAAGRADAPRLLPPRLWDRTPAEAGASTGPPVVRGGDEVGRGHGRPGAGGRRAGRPATVRGRCCLGAWPALCRRW